MIKNRRGKKAKFLKELEEYPLVELACRKVGISRATFYRWREQDYDFKVEVQQAEERSRSKVNDLAESKLLENVKNNDYRSIVYWLAHNNRRYRPPTVRLYADENNQQRTELETLKRLLNELVDHIGVDAALRIAGEDPEVFKAKIKKQLEDQRQQSDGLY